MCNNGPLSLAQEANTLRGVLMDRISRRDWHRAVLGGLAGAAVRPWGSLFAHEAASSAQPVIGVQSYSFRDRPLDAAIEGMKTVGLTSCELWQGHVEPKDVSREDLRKWRLTTPLAAFSDIGTKFTRAGITLNAYNLSFRDDFTDEEITRGFEMAKALGVPVLTASANQDVVRRVAPFAERAKMRVGVHNHSDIKPNEFATPADFTRALAVSPMIAVNLDIGHFTAANFDAVAFLREHHDRIVTLHIKDRRRNQGPAVPFGEGDAPIGEVLQLLRDRKWPIPANIEYEYNGADTVAEVGRCLEYCKARLTQAPAF
jgi:sugar phosphate isomerase/epimerase